MSGQVLVWNREDLVLGLFLVSSRDLSWITHFVRDQVATGAQTLLSDLVSQASKHFFKQGRWTDLKVPIFYLPSKSI